MNVMTVGLLCIAAYFVFMAWWLQYDKRKEREAGEAKDES